MNMPGNKLGLALLACLPLALQAGDNDISKVNGSVRVSADQPAGDVSTVNGSISVEDGVTADDVGTVNGSIRIGRNATVDSVDTVNGGVTLGAGSKASSVETVNGTLKFDENVHINGDVTAVNGTISLDSGSEVAGKIGNVNGKISLDNARVGGRLETVNGDIEIGESSRVAGGILVEKPGFNLFGRSKREPRIEIGPNAVVDGTLKFEHEVELCVSDSAKIGRIEGVEPLKCSNPSYRQAQSQAVEK